MSYSFDIHLVDGVYLIPNTAKPIDGPLVFVSVEDVLHNELGFCGCGMPDEAIRYVQRYLLLKSENEFVDLTQQFSGLGEFYFFMYWLDQKGYTEHGGSVGGAWLTQKGKTVLADLTHYLNE